ncbi:hypothetical protein BGZ47_000227, partial [Haplosporangium gracile]
FSSLPVPAASISLLAIPTLTTLCVEVFMPSERDHYVNSRIMTCAYEMPIIDAQLSTEFGRRLGLRAKSLNNTHKAIYITHGHVDHNRGTQKLLKVFSGTPRGPRIAIPQLWNNSTTKLEGEAMHLVPMRQEDTEHITTVNIPTSKGITFRPWNARSKKDITFTPSNGTFWGSDIVISGIHFLTDESESLAWRQDWIENAKRIRDHVKSNHWCCSL